MDNLRNVTKEIIKVADNGTNNYDIYDDVLKILNREFGKKDKKKKAKV